MPNLKEHCNRTLKLYGTDGKEIHQWLDNPVKLCGRNHREFRHDTESVKLAGKIFAKKYGLAVAESIALDHIMMDHAKSIGIPITTKHTLIQNEKTSPIIEKNYAPKPIVTIPTIKLTPEQEEKEKQNLIKEIKMLLRGSGNFLMDGKKC